MTLKTINHPEVANERITYALKKENFEKLVDIFSIEVQKVEEALIELSKQKDLDNISGIWLDFIGKIVGEDRQGRTDTEYRKALKIRTSVGSTSGTPNEIINIMKNYVNGDFARIVRHPLAQGTLHVSGTENLDNTLISLLEDIKPVSTSWIVSSDEADNGLYLAWKEKSKQLTDVNLQAMSGEVGMLAGESLAMAGNSEVESLLLDFSILDEGSLNGQNSLPYKQNITTFNVQCGESSFQFGESQAQLGNTENFIEGHEFERPLLWRITEDSQPS